MRAGGPPAPGPARPQPIIVPPIPPQPDEYVPPPVPDADLPEIDIRKKGVLRSTPTAAGRAAAGVWKFGWAAVLVAICMMYGLSHLDRNRPVPPAPIPPQVLVNPAPVVPVAPPVPPAPPPPAAPAFEAEPGRPPVQPAGWDAALPDGLAAESLVTSGPDNTKVGVIAADQVAVGHTFLAFDGETGAAAGQLSWQGPDRPVAASLSDNGTRLTVLLAEPGRAWTRRMMVYSLPGGDAILQNWLPPVGVKGNIPDELWFTMLGPDRLLTVSRHSGIELWSIPDGKRLYSVKLLGVFGPSKRALAVSPDRRLLAVGDGAAGMVFIDTATGASRGRTALDQNAVGSLNSAFSPDGKRLGLLRGFAGAAFKVASGWECRSCPQGAPVARWNVPGVARWSFWDADHLLVDAGSGQNRRDLREVGTGRSVASVDANDPHCLVTSVGRRLWYVCAPPPHGVLPKQHLVSLEPRPDLFAAPAAGPAPVRDWLLTPQGILERRQ
jgi:hypothetical protein